MCSIYSVRSFYVESEANLIAKLQILHSNIICDFNQPKYFLIRKGLFSKWKNMILGDNIHWILWLISNFPIKTQGYLLQFWYKLKNLKSEKNVIFWKKKYGKTLGWILYQNWHKTNQNFPVKCFLNLYCFYKCNSLTSSQFAGNN